MQAGRHAGRFAVVATVAVLALLAGCTQPGTAPQTTPSTTGTTGGSPGAPALDADSTLALNPVNYGGSGVAVATFGEAMAGRPVDLERSTDNGWKVIASGNQDERGRVEFRAPFAAGSHRAVAREATKAGRTLPAVATVESSRAGQWTLDFDEDFDGSSLDSKHWSPRQTGAYFGARMCSAPYPSMTRVKDGSWFGSVRRSSKARTREVARNTARQQGVPVADACPNGVWDAAMVSTEGKYSFKYGIAAVRAKFPVQSGVHGSAWLQGSDDAGVEIDFIETFGPKYGIQHKVHYRKNGKLSSLGGYVKSLPAVKTRDWWDAYHVISVEWTPDEYVFRVDGVETFRTKEGISQGQQFVVLSLLASDWELGRVIPADMPATLTVDWIRVWQQQS